MFAAVSCREKADEVEATETRPALLRDGKFRLDATPHERFRDARPAPVEAPAVPYGWLELPPTAFRLLNYRFGESGLGEVSVSVAAGSVLDNANRWLGQFGAAKIDEAGLAALPELEVAGGKGRWIEAAGVYDSGMGAEPREAFRLFGVIARQGSGILTVKMTGPADEVLKQRAALEEFSRGLKARP